MNNLYKIVILLCWLFQSQANAQVFDSKNYFEFSWDELPRNASDFGKYYAGNISLLSVTPRAYKNYWAIDFRADTYRFLFNPAERCEEYSKIEVSVECNYAIEKFGKPTFEDKQGYHLNIVPTKNAPWLEGVVTLNDGTPFIQNGHVSKIEGSNAIKMYSYDANNRVIRVRILKGTQVMLTFNYKYFDNGDLQDITAYDKNQKMVGSVNYKYHEGRLKSLESSKNTSTGMKWDNMEYEYDQYGGLTKVTYSYSVQVLKNTPSNYGPFSITCKNEYDSLGRVIKRHFKESKDDNVITRTYSYEGDGKDWISFKDTSKKAINVVKRKLISTKKKNSQIVKRRDVDSSNIEAVWQVLGTGILGDITNNSEGGSILSNHARSNTLFSKMRVTFKGTTPSSYCYAQIYSAETGKKVVDLSFHKERGAWIVGSEFKDVLPFGKKIGANTYEFDVNDICGTAKQKYYFGGWQKNFRPGWVQILIE